jgi:hypothetical protein
MAEVVVREWVMDLQWELQEVFVLFMVAQENHTLPIQHHKIYNI